jgi:hypothetical protein
MKKEIRRYLAFSHADIPFILNAFSLEPPPTGGIWAFRPTAQGFFPEIDLRAEHSTRMHRHRKGLWKLFQYLFRDHRLSSANNCERTTWLEDGWEGETLPPAEIISSWKLLNWFSSYTLLPLDESAIIFAQKSNLPYVLPGDFFTPKELRDLWGLNEVTLTSWANRFPFETLGWKENWARYSVFSFSFCSYPAHVAAALAQRFRENGTQLTVFRRQPPKFCSLHLGSDLSAFMWSELLPDQTLSIQYPMEPPLEKKLATAPPPDYSCLRDAVIFFFYEWENRHISAMKATKCGHSVVWMPLYRDLTPVDFALRALQHGGETYPVTQVPILPLPFPEESGLLSEQASDICQKVAEGIFPHASLLGPLFEEFATLCTRFDAQLESLLSIWSEFRPCLCLAETHILLGEYAVPLLACRQLGIPSIGLPHGALYFPEFHHIFLPATRSVFSNPFSEEAFRHAGVSGKTGSFTAVSLENEYPIKRYDLLMPRDGKINILVVTGPAMLNMPLMVTSTARERTADLEGLAATPPDLLERVNLAFKSHPSIKENWDYRLAGIGQDRVLPLDSSMDDALLTTDVLVTLNYAGNPSCLAMRKGIPVISCLTEGNISYRNPYMNRLVVAGLLAENPAATWEYISRLMDDNGFRDAVIARQNEFYKTWLRPKRDDWNTWLRETIEEGA